MATERLNCTLMRLIRFNFTKIDFLGLSGKRRTNNRDWTQDLWEGKVPTNVGARSLARWEYFHCAKYLRLSTPMSTFHFSLAHGIPSSSSFWHSCLGLSEILPELLRSSCSMLALFTLEVRGLRFVGIRVRHSLSPPPPPGVSRQRLLVPLAFIVSSVVFLPLYLTSSPVGLILPL
jgi:hypothetical protein